MNDFLPLVSTALGIVSTVAGGLAFYRSIIRKTYASERDFGHLRRNYENQTELLNQIDERLESMQALEARIGLIQQTLTAIDRTLLEIKIKAGFAKDE